MTDDNTQNNQTQDDKNNGLNKNTTQTKTSKTENAKDKNLQIAQLKEELATMTESAKRVMADLQNFKRRAEEERAELRIRANINLLESIFPAIDNLARAFEHTPEELKDNEWVKGIQVIETNLLAALELLGLKTIAETGIPADPNKHQVLMEGEGPAGEVTQIIEKGYEFNGKTIRPAKVQVGKS